MTLRLHALVLRSPEADASASFWAGLLGWERSGTDVRPPGEGVGLAFEATDAPKLGLNSVHLHLTSNARAQAETVERALALGATHLDVGQLPEEGHVVLADPGGNELCVIEEGNGWLAGTDLLGELAADGTRELGVFWSEALGWPLVWDEDGETAISPPSRRYKVAWGGPPLVEKHEPARTVVHVVADDLDAEVDRLVDLGARVRARGAYVTVEDPDGNEVRVSAG